MRATGQQARPDLREQLTLLNSYDVYAGLAVNPGTPIEPLFPFLGLVDVVNLLSVVPGASGQKFIPEVLPKIAALKAFSQRSALPLGIEVDGGINQQTVRLVRSAGANIVAAASALYRQHSMATTITRLRG